MTWKSSKWVPTALFFLWVGLTVFAAVRCGDDDKKDDDGDSKPPAGDDSSSEDPILPADWDGTTDWPDSPFNLVDE